MNSSFRITEVQQISKNRYLCTIAAEDHFEQDGVYYTKPRLHEVIKMKHNGFPVGMFLVVKKIKECFPHVVVLKRRLGCVAPKCRDVQYIPVYALSETIKTVKSHIPHV